MQTFLPYPSFDQSARVLDDRRLGKQRVEAYQILLVLRGQSQGWRSHPAVRMWRGHEHALGLYALAMCQEWVRRGFKDNLMEKVVEMMGQTPPAGTKYPEFVGDPAFHASHRSNLFRKDPTFYGRYGWTEGPNLPYVWPT